MEPPPQPSPQRFRVSEMDMHNSLTDEPSALFDWGDLLDFTADDRFAFSLDSDHFNPVPEIISEHPDQVQLDGTGRVRKRDPRLTCENFLAGRIPCACPEVDAMLEEEEEVEEGGPGKKRPRTARAAAGGTARCQVPGCEADIRELKGYHRRHRVCLRCANSSTVEIDGQSKRYCQQCGKFHILSDFDEGKRSCRRKLERHNNRRRRKPIGSKGSVENEPQGDLLSDDVSFDVEAGKDSLCPSNQKAEGEAVLESEDRQVSTLCSAPGSQNIQSDSAVSFMASGETQVDGGKGNSKYALSPSYCDNKSAYSSMCPTGRISFKLYDWNPAEFPRRLRHQIFQWLASMPVELEGYIRPGCTILTVFIAMPKFMWVKLFEDPASYLHDLIIAPGSLLSGRGTVLVYLNNMIFRVVKDGTSMMKVKMEVRAPQLHYVHPNCFEAGKPMEFAACGSNLLQPKFRFLVSFGGKYLENDSYVAFPHDKPEGDTTRSFDHQLYKIFIPRTEPNLFGPAFIEIENESGLSNFIPILIGDKDICSEMKILEQRFDASLCSKGSQFAANSCEVSVLRQTTLSEFILDIAWLLKEPASESIQSILTSSQIERYNFLLNFLICHDSTIILERVLQSLMILMENLELKSPVNGTGTSDIDMKLFRNNVDHASDVLCQKLKKSGCSVLQSQYPGPKVDLSQCCSQDDMLSIVPISNQNMEIRANGKFREMTGSTSPDRSETVPLLDKEVVMNVKDIEEWPRKSCSPIFSSTGVVLSSRPTVFLIATAVVCFSLCAVLLHPHKVSEFAVSIRRCLFEKL